jgi:O-antigen/teichoic acid export membrane protein
MTATSFLVPAAGLVTAPLLAHALSTGGRGQLAAALAPAGLMLAAATFGLPDALTYFLAKRPEITRRALSWASSITMALGVACVVIVWFAIPFLRDGNRQLGRLILLGALLTIPALVIGVFRGAASGRQMWGAVAAERLINTVARVGACVALFVVHDLTVLNALLLNVLTPIVAGVAYLPLLRRPAAPDLQGWPESEFESDSDSADVAFADGLSRLTSDPGEDREIYDQDMRSILTFGTRVWFGSVMSMVLDRADALLMAPLSNVSNLGIYSVAGTISDLPLIVALAIAGARLGVK